MLTRERFGFGSSSLRATFPSRSECLGAESDRAVSSAFSRVQKPQAVEVSLVTDVCEALRGRAASSTAVRDDGPSSRPSSALSRPPSRASLTAPQKRPHSALLNSTTGSANDDQSRPASRAATPMAGARRDSPTMNGRPQKLPRPASALSVVSESLGVRSAAGASSDIADGATPPQPTGGQPSRSALGGDRPHASGGGADGSTVSLSSLLRPSSAAHQQFLQARTQSRSQVHAIRSVAAVTMTAITSTSETQPHQHAAHESRRRTGEESDTRPKSRAAVATSKDRPPAAKCTGGFGFRRAATRQAVVRERAAEAKFRYSNAVPSAAAATRRDATAAAIAAASTTTTSRSPDVAVRPSIRDLAAAMRRPHSHMSSEAHLTGTLLLTSFNARVREAQRADMKRQRSPNRPW